MDSEKEILLSLSDIRVDFPSTQVDEKTVVALDGIFANVNKGEFLHLSGPNGSGKSNISDALCFVLGRL